MIEDGYTGAILARRIRDDVCEQQLRDDIGSMGTTQDLTGRF